MPDKYHSDTQEKIEAISYVPGRQSSGDLEAATRTITVTTKQATPDYSTSLTTSAPGDSRLVVKRLCVRLQVTIDSMTAGQLYGALYVNGVERKTFNFTSTGAKYTAVALTGGQFNVGIANTLEVFLWVDAGNAVVSVCQLWQGVGNNATDWMYESVLELSHTGWLSAVLFQEILGSGSLTGAMMPLGVASQRELLVTSVSGANSKLVAAGYLAATGIALSLQASVDTDLLNFSRMHFALRSER